MELKPILWHAYTRDGYINIIQNLSSWWLTIDQKTANNLLGKNSKITDAIQLGRFYLDGKEISVWEMTHSSADDARVTLTKETLKIMNRASYNYALVSYVSNNSDGKWRFSLITRWYNEWKEKVSSPRRYSFLLGEWEKIRTAVESLHNPLKDIQDLETRFDVEVVRKEFFRLYLNIFLELYKSLMQNADFQKEVIENNKQDSVKFTKNLMGKIIFLYFVQKKGRLWVPENEPWGKWNMDFIKTLFDDSISWEKMIFDTTKRKGNFYNDYLEPLFYWWLSKDRTANNSIHDYFRWEDWGNIKIPFLNWWLFSQEYDREHSDILPNNRIFQDLITSFDRYNFTIDEDDPYDREIAIDPEMLGKIFETMISISQDNIIEILEIYEKKTWGKPLDIDNIKHVDIENELNKNFWAFYTPREIVHYMTRESLLYYIINWLKERGKYEKNKTEREIDDYLEEKVRLLMKYKENYLTMDDVKQRVTWDVEMFFDIVKYVDRLLDDIKILDPAVGSGAFPMWLLHEIRTLKKYINDVFLERNISDYQIKKDIISNSIYGVDIEPGAIDIARLRFRLSLLVDTDKPEPLPNLEFKFVCADTLMPLYDDKNTLDLYQNNVMFGKYKFYMQKLFYPTKEYPKQDTMQKLKHFIDYFQWKDQTEFNQKLRTFDPFNSDNSAKFFDPEFMFGEEKFDIIIWNPPYIQLQKNSWYLANLYEKIWYKSFTRTGDIYCLFYEHAFDILKKWGICTFITSNKRLRTWYGEKLREFFAKNTNPLVLVDLWPDVFETATVDSNILIAQNMKVKDFYLKGLNLSKQKNIKNIEKFHEKMVILNELNKDARIIASLEQWSILSKIEKVWKQLKDCDVQINRWVITWFNEAFIIDEEKKNKIILQDITSSDIIKPILRWRDIERYAYTFNNNYIILAKYWSYKYLAEQYPAVYQHLCSFEKQLKERWQCTYKRWWSRSEVTRWVDFDWQHHWLELDNNPKDDYLNLFKWEKICWKALSLKPPFCYIKEEVYHNDKANIITSKKINLKYLCGILNSKLFQFQFSHIWVWMWQWFEYKVQYIKEIRIPTHTNEMDELCIANLVDKIAAEKKEDPTVNTSQREEEIDQRVYKLYGLTYDEVKVVDPKFTMSEKDYNSFSQ